VKCECCGHEPPELCKACGQPLPQNKEYIWDKESRVLTYRGRSLRFPDLMARLFDIFHNNKSGRVMHRTEIIEKLYADDRDGGPLGDGIAGAYTWKLNERLRGFGLEINQCSVRKIWGEDRDRKKKTVHHRGNQKKTMPVR
jgi:hypothetical protein